MPQRVFCKKCGTVLYEGAELKGPDEIIQQYNGKCPKCSERLSLVPEEVVVKPARK
jgi:RNase P subunit RPR2